MIGYICSIYPVKLTAVRLLSEVNLEILAKSKIGTLLFEICSGSSNLICLSISERRNKEVTTTETSGTRQAPSQLRKFFLAIRLILNFPRL